MCNNVQIIQINMQTSILTKNQVLLKDNKHNHVSGFVLFIIAVNLKMIKSKKQQQNKNKKADCNKTTCLYTWFIEQHVCIFLKEIISYLCKPN